MDNDKLILTAEEREWIEARREQRDSDAADDARVSSLMKAKSTMWSPDDLKLMSRQIGKALADGY